MAKKTKSIAKTSSDEESFVIEQTPALRAVDILKQELPRLINDITMLIRRPFRLIWDESVGTASTDCLAEIKIAPRPFLEGEREIGYGTAYHETGHICYSPYGVELLSEAYKEGGDVLQSIMNIILDRKDDVLTAREAPGFADTLRKRLLVIRTMSKREKYKHLFAGMSLKKQSQILRNFKPTDSFEDFFLAAKCGKSPRFKSTHKAMKYVKFSKLINASPEKLLWISKKVREILGEDMAKSDQEKVETKFIKLWTDGENAVGGGVKLDNETKNAIQNVMKQYLGGLRKQGIASVLKKLASMSISYPGPISVGLENEVPVKRVKKDPRFLTGYQRRLLELASLVNPMIKVLRNISTPSEFELYGQEEGELDLTEVARIATGLGGIYMETVIERDIDAEIHLAIDNSGSMHEEKIEIAKKIAIVFSEAIKALDPHCSGRVWSFNSKVIYDLGKIPNADAFVALKGSGGNSDTHMLKAVGSKLLRSTKRRKILFVLCDDGPDDMQLAKKMAEQLTARGVIVIHLLVGVHGTPDIYPIELLYTNMEECLEEFGSLLQTIISNLK